MAPGDWPFLALGWSDAYGRRSLTHFVEKWRLKTAPDYVAQKRQIYIMRRWQGMLVPIMRKLPVIGRYDPLAKKLARAVMFPERLVNEMLVARHDWRVARAGRGAAQGRALAQQAG